jgi:putative GTP pyrophosphokinase
MKASDLSRSEQSIIEPLVEQYNSSRGLVEQFLSQMKITIADSERLRRFIHSVKFRLKDPEHLRDKLHRKLSEAQAKNKPFTITKANLLAKVNDLAGLRVLHLHTSQMEDIHPIVLELLDNARFKLLEKPFARTWDDENRNFFTRIGIKTQDSGSLYTSVHYTIESASKIKVTGEIQIRTLAEELWGEVDHSINYPKKTTNLACREQIAVLARVTSSCSRLVDSIFKAYASTPETTQTVQGGPVVRRKTARKASKDH